MRRSALLCVFAGLAGFALGCSSDEQQPSLMEPSTELAPDDGAHLRLRCRNNGLIVVQLAGILPSNPPARLLQNAILQFGLVELALLQRKKPLAQTRALALIDFLIDNRANLLNPNSQATATKLGNVIDAILCVVGLQPSGIVLGPNTGIGVVPANNTQPVVITTPQGTAGILAPIGTGPAVNQQGQAIPGVVVTVTGLGNTRPLNTPLDQYGQTVELTASEEVLWQGGGVAVAVCVTADDSFFDRLRLGHEGGILPKFGAIEILPPAGNTAITAVVGTCSGPISARSAFGRISDLAMRTLLPSPLHAAAAFAAKTGGVGGTTRNFSPFRAVDPQLTLEALPASTDGTAGAPVAVPPSVRIRTQEPDRDRRDQRPVPGPVGLAGHDRAGRGDHERQRHRRDDLVDPRPGDEHRQRLAGRADQRDHVRAGDRDVRGNRHRRPDRVPLGRLPLHSNRQRAAVGKHLGLSGQPMVPAGLRPGRRLEQRRRAVR